MTREEAIEWIRSCPSYHDKHTPLKMAIEALQTLQEQEPCEDENDVMPLSKAIEIILNIDSSDRLRTEAEGVLVRFALRKNCDDCISRQAAIDEIEERKNANGYRNVAVISELNRLEGYIMRLPSVQPERQWIPCSERLPEENGHYLVTLHTYGELDFKVDETVVKIIPFFDKWRLPTHIPEWINEALTQEVLAWMPLPEFYKEEQ